MLLSRPLGGLNVNTGWAFPKVSELEMRAFKRLFGIESPSLIHNGKKRRKS